jgi:hypothetical protein
LRRESVIELTADFATRVAEGLKKLHRGKSNDRIFVHVMREALQAGRPDGREARQV